MSYGFRTIEPVAPDDLADSLRNDFDKIDAANPLSAEAREQGLAALECVTRLVESGALGTAPVNVNIAGHANPGHAPLPGWANDGLTISIHQA